MKLPTNRRDFLKLSGLAALLPAGVGSVGVGSAEVTTGRPQQSGSAQTTVAGWEQVAKLAANDGDNSDQFGWSVALDGDTALIGTPADEGLGGGLAGSAYVFRRSGGSWDEEAKLIPTDREIGDEFSRSVALDSDTALIAAPNDNPNGIVSGSAYVFRRSGGSWNEEVKLIPTDGDSGDTFGRSVGIDGDTALISADSDEGGGSAYVFRRSGESWNEEAKLTPADGDVTENFGSAVGIDGGTALIGLDDDDLNGPSSGSAYVFRRSGGSWNEEAKLTPTDGNIGDYFGSAVGMDGDTALVGAFGDEDPNGNGGGSAYVFRRSGGSWDEEAKLIPTDGDNSDSFGWSVGIDGDTAVIGTLSDEDPNGNNSGSAYVFKRSEGNWSQEAKLATNDGDDGDDFGQSVGVNGGAALIGADSDEDPNGRLAGSAYLFERAETGFGETGTVSTNQSDSSTWQTVALTQTYDNPVVIMGPVSYNGSHPVHVRLRNVESGSFEFQLEEWDYLDGGHTVETIHYIVMEAGTHVFPDGTNVEAGTITLDENRGGADFSQLFDSTPVLLTQVQTRSGPQAVVTRQTPAGEAGFFAELQEEGNNNGKHKLEQVGYIALGPGSGTNNDIPYEIGRTGSVTDEWESISFGQDMDTTSVFIARIQTTNGGDPAALRYRNLDRSSVDVFVEEERSRDDETRHTSESVGYAAFRQDGILAAGDTPTTTSVIGERGSATGNQPDTGTWQPVTLNNTYNDPVVVASPVSYNGGHPVHVRLRNVQNDSFEFQLEEWDYLDGSHTTETIHYAVMEAGVHTLPDGTRVEAQNPELSGLYRQVSFSQRAFDTVPIVLSQAQTTNGRQAIVTRHQQMTADGLSIVMIEQERFGAHTAETIGYIAIEPGSGTNGGDPYEVRKTDDSVTDETSTISFDEDIGSAPVFLAQIQSYDGSDTANLRYRSNGNSVYMFIEEERSADRETNHTTETVGYLVFGSEGDIRAETIE